MTTFDGELDWGDGRRTWYRVCGDLAAGPTPAILLHGGPGAGHDYLENMPDLLDGRPSVLYDQIGCGRSSHHPEWPAEDFNDALWLDELMRLARHLGIENAYHVIGQSWGGMLAMRHALDHPPGLRSIVVCNSPASMALWISENAKLRALLPEGVQGALDRHEATGDFAHPEYQEAVMVFYRRHLCRLDEWPDGLARSGAYLEDRNGVYNRVNGPSEFHVIGHFKDWDITDRLHEITTPTLLLSGEFDEATPGVVRPIHEGIAGSRWEIVPGTSHTTHVEAPDAWRAIVVPFLAEVDRSRA